MPIRYTLPGGRCIAPFSQVPNKTHEDLDREIDRLHRKLNASHKELQSRRPRVKGPKGAVPSTTTTGSSTPQNGQSAGDMRELEFSSSCSEGLPVSESLPGAMLHEEQYKKSPSLSNDYSSFSSRLRQNIQESVSPQYAISTVWPSCPLSTHQETSYAGNRVPDWPNLPQAKEEELLSTFQQGLDYICLIVSYADIQVYHNRLWNDTSSTSPTAPIRKPSALLDVLLALAMQYRSVFILRDTSDRRRQSIITLDSCIAGDWLFKRSQWLLASDKQCPSLQSLQASTLGVLYLYNAGAISAAGTSLATSIRMAEMLGLHCCLAAGQALGAQSDIRVRVWRTLMALDVCLAMAMDLSPIIVQPSTDQLRMEHNNASLPSDPNEAWSFFQTYHMNIILGAESLRAMIRRKQTELLEHMHLKHWEYQPLVRESVAAEVVKYLGAVQERAKEVPESLQLKRHDGSEPFGFMESSALNLDSDLPQWQLHQMLYLEITYHHLISLALRPFLGFELSDDSTCTNQADLLRVAGLKHAMTLIHILNHAFTETETLEGWLFLFHCQWDAAQNIVGYILKNPSCTHRVAAKRALYAAKESFSAMERYLDAARAAVKVIEAVLNGDGARKSPEDLLWNTQHYPPQIPWNHTCGSSSTISEISLDTPTVSDLSSTPSLSVPILQSPIMDLDEFSMATLGDMLSKDGRNPSGCGSMYPGFEREEDKFMDMPTDFILADEFSGDDWQSALGPTLGAFPQSLSSPL
ncbi:hypothetical protein HIM_01196 [Hirsutella minnesotensis 3608]|nr:hypothetical protein HIM_01196 [Hirsutella minnesotensis 3608]